ncbi:MAG: sigma-70 family RNA polymerase sigma factor [Planctomycetota bacterium]
MTQPTAARLESSAPAESRADERSPDRGFDLATREGFEAFYSRHNALVLAYVTRRVGSREVAEDLTSETFLAALRGRRTYRDRGFGPRPWLLRIASNTVAKWWKHQDRKPRPIAQEIEADAVPSDGPELAEALRRSLGRLPLKSQIVVSLFHVERLGVREIASAIGCKPDAVKARLVRARTALRRELKREGVTQ